MNKPLISFIVPVYNVEKYIEKCVNSLLSQKKNTFEIILVDDGSTDASPEICDRYTCNKLIKVFHKENGGLSDARNYGIERANGKYILFVDSDDYIASDFIEDLLKYKNDFDSDIILLNVIKFFEDGSKMSMNNGYEKINFNKKIDDIKQDLIYLNKLPASACDKMIKKDFLIKNNFFFEINKLSEDIEWSINVLLNAETIDYFNHDYYFYRQNRFGSISNTVSYKNYIHIFNTIKKFVDKNEKKVKYQNVINALLSYEYIMVLSSLYKFEGDEYINLEQLLKEYKWLLNCGKYKRVKIVKMIVKVFGIKGTAFLFQAYREFSKR